jgi:beta-aspartyl-peptidase (threonine type)
VAPWRAALVTAAILASGAAPAERVVLAVHGGAGAWPRERLTPEREKAIHSDLEKALRAGLAALSRDGGTSLGAVEAAVRVLEDSPLFNAGRGAVFTRDGRVELDASVMEGKDRRAGAVACVTRLKNPVSAARLVMEKSEHVLMVADGAERFALRHGAEEAGPLYFWTEERWRDLQKAAAKAAEPAPGGGTVGAVALDRSGTLAAATSTGGMNYKRPGRAGDSPIIGAGTYADNATCAVSCTGHGEVFIRFAVAHDVAARVRYKNETASVAAAAVLKGLPPEKGGMGGLIVLDRDGRAALLYDTGAMPRGTITADGTVWTAIDTR